MRPALGRSTPKQQRLRRARLSAARGTAVGLVALATLSAAACVTGGGSYTAAASSALPPPSTAPRLIIATYNLLHGWPELTAVPQRTAHLAAALRGDAVDVACLQEVAVSRAAHVPSLLEAATGQHVVYARANGSAALIGFEEGLAVVSRFPMLAVEVLPLPRPGPFERRIALRALIDAPGLTVDMMCTHLSHRAGPRRDRLRLRQAERLLAHIAEPPAGASRTPHLLVLAGDLNVTPDSAVYRRLIGAGLRDAAVAGGSPHPTYPSPAPRRRIDYVFIASGQAAQSHPLPFRVDSAPFLAAAAAEPPHWGSDHVGVLVRINPRP